MTVQTYQNHTRWLAPFHFFVLPVLLVNVVLMIRHVYLETSLSTGFACLVAAALFMAALLARIMALTAQDRLIRLEMRLRLRELLPPDLKGRINDLTRDQFVALRFAGDAELPDLMRKVLDGSLKTRKEIKLAVKNWQGDYLRV